MKAKPALLALALLATACAAPRAPRPPEGEDFMYPAPRAGELRQDEAPRFEKAWREILAGNSEGATKLLARMLKAHPGLAPVQAAFGYARLRAGRHREAQQSFDAALASRPEYVPALVGGAAALRKLGDPERALALLKRAEAVAPTNAMVTRRLAELKLQIIERRVAAARTALQGGDRAAALNAYRLALQAAPEVAALRIEYANLQADGGDVGAALETLRGDPAADRQVLMRLGELLTGQGDPAGALEAYRIILQRDVRDVEAQERALRAREAMELEGLPSEYARIAGAAFITRADLCALAMVKVPALRRLDGRDPDVAVDISGSWARDYVLAALSLGILDVYPNHTFQPGATVRRADLARAVARILDLLRYPQGVAPTISDMSRNNLFYDAAARAVAAGLMDLTPAGGFEAWRPVSGRDASDVIEALARLVGP
jgi:tetratricopeptide (TPR) repeat protein